MRIPAKPEWEGEDAFVIGGGASLRTFDFDWLRGRRTLGVNDAFTAGPSRCEEVLFADHSFWRTKKWELEKYARAGGKVSTVCVDRVRYDKIAWVNQYSRGNPGLSVDPSVLGWNYNTGASALNLALLKRARRVFLLGFDMTPVHGNTHWHNNRRLPTTPASFGRFLSAFETVAKDLVKFPGCEVFNVGPGVSKIKDIPKMTFDQMREVVK